MLGIGVSDGFRVFESRVATVWERGVEIALDDYLEVYVNREHYTTIVLNPAHIEDTLVGLLLGEGLADSVSEIREITLEGRRADITVEKSELKPGRLYVDDCAVAGELKPRLVASRFSTTWSTIKAIYLDFNKRTASVTRGLAMHTSALYDLENKVIAVAHDVSRHTSIAKLIGIAVRENADFEKSIAVTTGRASSDMVLRLARVGVPILISTRGPLASGVRAARAAGATLVSYSRAGPKPGFMVLSGSERIAGED